MGTNGLENDDTESASPAGTVSVTSAPVRLALGAPGGVNARSSVELQVTAWPGVTGALSGAVAASLDVLQKSVGDSDPATPATENASTPVWKHGSSVIVGGGKPWRVCVLVTKLPLSMPTQPVQPDSVKGLPPLPVRICSWPGVGAPAPE